MAIRVEAENCNEIAVLDHTKYNSTLYTATMSRIVYNIHLKFTNPKNYEYEVINKETEVTWYA